MGLGGDGGDRGDSCSVGTRGLVVMEGWYSQEDLQNIQK